MVFKRDTCFRFAASSENSLVSPPGLTFIVLLTEPVAAIRSEQCVTVWGEWGHKQWVTKVGVNASRYFHFILVASWEKRGGKKLSVL